MRAAIFLLVVLTSAGPSWASHLDVSASYRMDAASYGNLNLDDTNKNNHSFIFNDARLGVAVRKIALENAGGEETAMDVGLTFHALGVTGSTGAIPSPFDRAAANYPSSDFTPFIENAYVRVYQLMGYPVEGTFGRQSFRLGSGLLLDDDGAGFTGVTLRGELPWWGFKLQGFAFHDHNDLQAAPNSLDLFGFNVDLPVEGTWQLNQLFERDRAVQPVYGCVNPNPAAPTPDCLVGKALRSFTSLHYQIAYGPMVLDGEAAMDKGAADPTGPTPAPGHITYQGDAEVVRAKWKQSLYKTGEGIARVSLARGSGDKLGTTTKDEAFFPSHGHRYNGLERSGFGDFFAATPYDAYGGNYSTTTKSGLQPGASGIAVVGAGYTTPAYHGVNLDADYFLQADRVASGSRSLGSEWDFRLRYALQDHLLALSGALFKMAPASNNARGSARKFSFEASGRF
jgi:hypothetical protein